MPKIFISCIEVSVSFCIIMISLLWSLDASQTDVKYPADIIVSLGGGTGSRVEKAWDLQIKGYSRADNLLITGIPVNAESVINIHPRLKYLQEHKDIHYIPVSILAAKNTWEEVLFLKSYMQKNNLRSVIIVTHPLHSGRVKMSLDRVAQYKESGLEYTLVSDREVDVLQGLLNDKKFRIYALREMLKRVGYEVRALRYNIALSMENI